MGRLFASRNQGIDLESSPDSERPNRMFIHIPKTAGTSFRKGMEKYLGKKRILADYGNRKRETSREIQQAVYDSNDVFSLERYLRKRSGRIVTGHFNIARYGGIIGLSNTVTFLRNPISRITSHYRHAIRHQGYTDSLMEFVQAVENQNLQCRLLGQLDPALIGLVGITEKYRESIELVNRYWGWNLPYREDNIGTRRPDFSVEPSLEELEEIKKLNSNDQLLYDRALHLFSNSRYCYERNISMEPRGMLSRSHKKNVIDGWAFNLNGDEAVEVNIFVDGREECTMIADHFRVALAGWGTPRAGYVGFRLNSVSLLEGNRVDLRDAKHDLLLDSYTV